ncbi:radical SAM protein [Clostridium sp. YIM B02505]|uniref:Radical SAM protein n=1 Tax=Clostridium yunnanense TaxID=2800325 RepID=A0ABS1EJL7_9CLOT|nr:radical SAM protein [Clostridium yunnanense]MBK1809550.1 radical SAM protein [Clostridium yunnanense]
MAVNLWLTYKCNLNCSYCYEKDIKIGMKNKLNDNTIDDYLIFIENFLYDKNRNENEPYIVNLHGGEPLLEFNLLKKVVGRLKQSEKLKSKKIMFGVTTNGTLLNEEIIDFLCENFHYSLSVSIDGIKENHDRNRKFANGEGSFKLIIDNALKILHKRSDIRIRMTFDSRTVKDLCENIIYLLSLGFNNIVPVANIFDDEWNEESSEELEKQLEMIMDHDVYKRNKNCHIGILESIKAKNVKMKCNGGINTINISPDGNIYPCTYVVGKEEYKIGDVFIGFNNEKIDYYKSVYKCKTTKCEGCLNYNYCKSGRCKFINKVITGDFLTPAVQVCMLSNIEYKIWKSKFYNKG